MLQNEITIPDRAFQRLAIRVLLDAVKGAARGDAQERAWLNSTGIVPWCRVIGLDPGLAQRRAMAWLQMDAEGRSRQAAL